MTPSQKSTNGENVSTTLAHRVLGLLRRVDSLRVAYEAILLKNIAGIDVLPHLKDRPARTRSWHVSLRMDDCLCVFQFSLYRSRTFLRRQTCHIIQAAEEKYKGIYPIPKSTVLPQDMKLALTNLPDSSMHPRLWYRELYSPKSAIPCRS